MWNVESVAKITQGLPLNVDRATPIDSFCIDSRNAVRGSLFVAIKGNRTDGHNFVHDSVMRGASVALVSRPVEGAPQILVRDTIRALCELASAYRLTFRDTKVIGVTGSVGKTTVKEMIGCVLGDDAFVSEKSFNNNIGLPLTLLSFKGGKQFVVVELGTNNKGEIAQLARISYPDVCIITAIAPAHLQGLGSLKEVALEKCSIFKKAGCMKILNARYQGLWYPIVGESEKITYGIEEPSNYRAKIISSDERGTIFRLRGCTFTLNVPGVHNVYNALAAIIVGRKCAGIPLEEIAQRLSVFKMPEMRMNVCDIAGVTLINDAYNANPESVTAAVEFLHKNFSGRRKIFVFGNMEELGDYTEHYHRMVGKCVADSNIAAMVCVGDKARIAGEEALSKEVHLMSSNDEALRWILANMKEGDVFLFKGSRKMELEKIWEGVRNVMGNSGTKLLEHTNT